MKTQPIINQTLTIGCKELNFDSEN